MFGMQMFDVVFPAVSHASIEPQPSGGWSTTLQFDGFDEAGTPSPAPSPAAAPGRGGETTKPCAWMLEANRCPGAQGDLLPHWAWYDCQALHAVVLLDWIALHAVALCDWPALYLWCSPDWVSADDAFAKQLGNVDYGAFVVKKMGCL